MSEFSSTHPYPIPQATYRLQFNKDFTFSQATKLIPYLKELGISHCYASPYLKARPGSMHGYDITDHNLINPEIGTNEDFENFVTSLKNAGMGQLLDMVPNHVGIMGSDNHWWMDVLENGQASLYAEYFDIDWHPPKAELHEKVLIPILGDQYGNVLEKGELKLSFDETNGEFSLFYYDHRFPIDPKGYPQILSYELETGEDNTTNSLDEVTSQEFKSLITAFGNLPSQTETSQEAKNIRDRDKQIHKRHLGNLCQQSSALKNIIQSNVTTFNGTPGDSSSFDLLHNLIKAQAFRLAYWRVAADDINYRRFFDINDLAALRMEEPSVFSKTHQFVLELLTSGKVDGLRIDHPDGLYDPLQYFQRLQQAFYEASQSKSSDTHFSSNQQYFYLTIEKIVASYEHLSKDWPVAGTTGYRFANVLNGIFVDTTNEKRMTRIYSAFINEKIDFHDLVYKSKKLILRVSLASQLNVLANELSRIALSSRHTCDFTVNSLRDALMEILACFPIYRTYVTKEKITDDDVRFIDWAVRCAKKKSTAADVSVFDFIRDVLLTTIAKNKPDNYQNAVLRFAMRIQQLSSPVMAKAMEDTSFYIYHRLTSLNEVGGDPGTFGLTINAFHGASQDRAKHWPHTMLATSTHDGKRSEDVRSRINVLSEIPVLWKLHIGRWKRINSRKKITVEEQEIPTRNDEYLLYQTLIGAWPVENLDEDQLKIFVDRIKQYMLKAIREAKVNTSWLNPNAVYENAISEFIDTLLSSNSRNLFLEDFLPFQRLVSKLGMLNSLSQTLIKLTSPGIPDLYQGTELWDFSLVDPDNRRPVNYDKRMSLLKQLKTSANELKDNPQQLSKMLLDDMQDGHIKLYIIWKALDIRRNYESIYKEGDYYPLKVEGEMQNHICAFARIKDDQMFITIAPRFFHTLITEQETIPIGEAVWKNTYAELPSNAPRRWTNVLTGETISSKQESDSTRILIKELFQYFPYALLVTNNAL